MRRVCERGEDEARYKASTMQIDNDVGVLCTARFPNNWTMFVVCAKQQMDAKLTPDQKPTRPDFSIERKCSKEYPDDFSMRRYCEQRQDEARDKVGNWIPDDIARKCTNEWSADWVMFVHCAEQQVKSQM